MNINRVIGFALLFLGVGIILFSLASSYLIFTGQNEAAQVFRAPQTMQEQELSPGFPQNFQEQIPQLLSEQLQGLLPKDATPRMLNLFVWSMLGGLLIFGGSMIAGIGVKMLK